MRIIKENWKWVVIICVLAFSLKWCHQNIIQEACAKDRVKAKFYDFSDQLIDGEIKRPTALYTDSRQEAKFSRLLRLKRSFERDLMDTARLPVFK